MFDLKSFTQLIEDKKTDDEVHDHRHQRRKEAAAEEDKELFVEWLS